MKKETKLFKFILRCDYDIHLYKMSLYNRISIFTVLKKERTVSRLLTIVRRYQGPIKIRVIDN